MSYRSTPLVDNNYYHVYSRGNEKRDIFINPRDYLRFINKISEYSEKDGVEIICYCLMPNHYHLLLKQLAGGSISNFIHRLQTGYAMYTNIKRERVGHLFQGPFKSKLIEDDAYILQVSKYIHLNPKSIREDPAKYRWSSLKFYLGTRAIIGKFLKKDIILNYFDQPSSPKAYQDFIFSDEEIPEDILLQE